MEIRSLPKAAFVFLSVFLTISTNSFLFAQLQPGSINRTLFYKAFSSTDTILINQSLNQLEEISNQKNMAFKAALEMKKAGLLPTPKQRLANFRKWEPVFEKTISEEPKNLEYRFLRLAIQENCPSVLGYKGNIKEDAQLVNEGKETLTKELQLEIKKYSGQSTALKDQNK